MVRAHLVAICIPVLLAAGLLGPSVLAAGFLSDDYVLLNLLTEDGGAADWFEIARQFGDRWLYSQAYWRPIINVVYGLNADLAGFTPIALASVNLALHLITVAATAHLAFQLSLPQVDPWIRATASILAGAAVTAHPAAAETVLWISARVTGVEVCFRMLALVAFLAYLREPTVGRRAASIALCALALASKESAVVLPLALLAIDVLDAPGRPLHERVQIHAPLLILWSSYAIVRVFVLGAFVGSPVPEPGLFGAWEILQPKLEGLFGVDGIAHGVPWAIFGLAFVLVPAVRHGGAAQAAAWTLFFWLLACFAPTYKTPLGAGLVGTRMLYDALPVLGLMLAYGLVHAERPVTRLAATIVGAVALGVGFPPTEEYAAEFRTAFRSNEAARLTLEERGRSASAEKPLAILSFPPTPEVPGPINPVSYFALGRAPYAAEPFPAVGLGSILDRFPFAPEVWRDPRPIHAALAAGSAVARFDVGRDALAFWERAPELTALVSEGDALDLPTGTHPLTYEELVVVVEGPIDGGAVALRTSVGEFGGPAGLPLAAGGLDGQRSRQAIDLTSRPDLLALAMADGTLDGFRAVVTGPGRVVGIEARPRVAELPLTARFDGRRVPFADLDDALIAPEADPTDVMHLLLLGEATAFRVPVTPGEPVRLPKRVLDQVRNFGNALHARRFWYAFAVDAAPGRAAARTALDRFEVSDLPRH